jgi:two-component system, OmpR family, KDP operon response regulator KdpE
MSSALLKSDYYQDSHLIVRFGSRTILLDGHPVTLTRKEFALLTALMRHPGEVVPRNALLGMVWGYQPGVRTRTLDVHIRRVRKHFGPLANQYIETIFAVGYRFQPYDRLAPMETPVTRLALERDEPGTLRCQ